MNRQSIGNTLKGIVSDKYLLILMGIVLIATLIKSIGFDWGFPATLHNDESVLIRSALGMRFGELNPHHFDWPSFSFYLYYLVFLIFIKIRVALQLLFTTNTMQDTFPFWWGANLPFYYIGRWLVNVALISTTIVTYASTNQLFKNKKISIIAALLFFFGYWMTYFSYYALPDMTLTFLVLTSFYFCIKITKEDNISNYLLAATFAGLATSTKYHGFLICIIIVVAHIIRTKSLTSLFDIRIILAGIISVLFFFVGSPYALIDWNTFMGKNDATGAMWQVGHMGFGLNWLYHLVTTPIQNFGYIIYFFFICGIYVLITKEKTKQSYLLLVTLSIFILYLGTWGIKRPHYSLFLFPLFSMISAYGIWYMLHKANPPIRYLLIIGITLSIIIPSSIEVYKRSQPDTRIEAGEWITDNIPENTIIFSNLQKVGPYGGDMPVFEYRKYNINQYSDINNISLADNNSYFLVITSAIDTQNRKYDMLKVFNNKWQTGPQIIIMQHHIEN